MKESHSAKKYPTAHEAVGLFHDLAALEGAVSELEVRDFPREGVSIIGRRGEVEKTFGVSVVAPEEAEDNPATPRRPPVRPEERAIGAGVLIGAGAYMGGTFALLAGGVSLPAVIPAFIAGGAVGGLFARLLGKRAERYVREQIEKGGLLLWVSAPDRAHEKTACRIMKKYGAMHVRVHDIAF